jgi:prepilin-type N-terminal cleavage/methylation domain-containing protein
MNERGTTLPELLIAIAIGAVVLLGVGSFYWRITRAYDFTNDQAAVQRAGTVVQQEMTRVILASDGVPAGVCGPTGNPQSLRVSVPVGALPETAAGPIDVCFYWGATPGGIFECQFNPAGSPVCTTAARDLLAGAATRQTVQASAVTFTPLGNAAAAIAFSLRAVGAGGTVTAGPLAFSLRVGVRN